MTDTPFRPFGKIARLSREIVITEKIDGTNGLIYIGDDGEFLVGSRSRWITPGKNTDNAGFAAWAYAHKDELMTLGPGSHYGEWWGQGIQRNYGQKEKHFSLFNVGRRNVNNIPACCKVVPTLYIGKFDTDWVDYVLRQLAYMGSAAAPGFMDPEGIVIYHAASGTYFKKTIKNDEAPKSLVVEDVVAVA